MASLFHHSLNPMPANAPHRPPPSESLNFGDAHDFMLFSTRGGTFVIRKPVSRRVYTPSEGH